MRSRSFLAMVFSLICGCSGKSSPAPDASPGVQALAPLMTPAAVVRGDAFDIAPIAGGAVIAYVTSAHELRVARLSETGSVLEGPLSLLNDVELSSANELVVAAGGGRWGAMWIDTRLSAGAPNPSAQPQVHAVSGSLSSIGSVRKETLGTSVAVSDVGRGRLAMFANDAGELQAMFRTTPYDCQASEGECARYIHRRLGQAERTPARALDTMEIASVCEPLIGGAILSRGTWFYSVCSGDPFVAPRVFSLRPEISYAAVHDGPANCVPNALVPTDEGAWSISRCVRETRVDVLFADAHTEQRLFDAHTELSCGQDGTPKLHAVGRDRSDAPVDVTTDLAGLRTRLEGALPAEMSRPHTRAVWTGKALLIGSVVNGRLAVHRWRCASTGQGPIYE